MGILFITKRTVSSRLQPREPWPLAYKKHRRGGGVPPSPAPPAWAPGLRASGEPAGRGERQRKQRQEQLPVPKARGGAVTARGTPWWRHHGAAGRGPHPRITAAAAFPVPRLLPRQTGFQHMPSLLPNPNILGQTSSSSVVKSRCFDLSVRDLIISRSSRDTDISCQGPFEFTFCPEVQKKP